MLVEAGIPTVCGSTGWLENFESIASKVKGNGGSFFYASNYSIGMNLIFRLTEYAAKFMNNYPEYEVDIEEIHHTEKKDMPSGTAITLVEKLIKNLDRKKSWVLNETAKDSEIAIAAVREPNVPGTHNITFRSAIDTIELSHTAHSRLGFAHGAIVAGEWLLGKKGVYGMDDLLK